MTNDITQATDDNGHRLTAEEIGMMTDQFNFNAFVEQKYIRYHWCPLAKKRPEMESVYKGSG